MTDASELAVDEPTEGTEVITADVITIGDLVYFRRVSPNRVALYRLKPEEQAVFSGRLMRVEAGRELGGIRLVSVRLPL